MMRAQHGERLVDGAAVAVQELLELHRQIAQAFGFGGGVPLAPMMDAVVEEQALHDDGDEGGQMAASLELADYGVVLVDQLELDDGGELLGFRFVEALAARRESDHAFDELEIGFEERTGIHGSFR